MTVYLCTCGTSAARNLPKEPRFDANWIKDHGGIDDAAQEIFNGFKEYRFDDEPALRNKLSAEIHSLARMNLSDKDAVILYSSETDDGQACAKAVHLYLQEKIPGVRCEVDVVTGLQVNDATRFRTQGVVNFVHKILAQIADNGAEQCVLNPTGGFKSLVPYTALIGMIKKGGGSLYLRAIVRIDYSAGHTRRIPPRTDRDY